MKTAHSSHMQTKEKKWVKKRAEKWESKRRGGGERGEGKIECLKMLQSFVTPKKKKCRISFSFDRFGHKLCIHAMFDISNYNVHSIVYRWGSRNIYNGCVRQFGVGNFLIFLVEVKESRRCRPIGDIFSRTGQIQLFTCIFLGSQTVNVCPRSTQRGKHFETKK